MLLTIGERGTAQVSLGGWANDVMLHAISETRKDKDINRHIKDVKSVSKTTQSPSNLADRKALQGAEQVKYFHRQKREEQDKEVTLAEKWVGYCNVTLL